MTNRALSTPILSAAALVAATIGLTLGVAPPAPAKSDPPIPLKEAKLNIEHNATAHDTGFQGFVDSEGWKRLDVAGPDGIVLSFRGRGELGKLGLTELFFETVEPENRACRSKKCWRSSRRATTRCQVRPWRTATVPAGRKASPC